MCLFRKRNWEDRKGEWEKKATCSKLSKHRRWHSIDWCRVGGKKEKEKGIHTLERRTVQGTAFAGHSKKESWSSKAAVRVSKVKRTQLLESRETRR